jgi:hypothetical protein
MVGTRDRARVGDSIGPDLEAQRLAEAIPGGLGVDVNVAGDAETERQARSLCLGHVLKIPPVLLILYSSYGTHWIKYRFEPVQ